MVLSKNFHSQASIRKYIVHFKLFFSYLKTESDVHKNIASLERTRKEVQKRNVEIQTETEREEMSVKAAKQKEKEQEKACKYMNSELDQIKQYRDVWMKKTGST